MKNGNKIRTTAICIVLVFILSSCSSKSSGEQTNSEIELEEVQAPITYKMDTVKKGDIVKTTSIDCSYVQMKSQDLSFPFDNKIIAGVYVKKGDIVKKGDVIIKLRLDDQEEAIKDLTYKIEYNKILLSQQKKLKEFDLNARKEKYALSLKQTNSDKAALKEMYLQDVDRINGSYKSTIENCEDSLQVDEFKLEQYQKEIEEGTLVAQMDGTVASINQNLYNATTEENKVIAKIVDDSVCVFRSDDIKCMEYIDKDEPLNITVGTYGNTTDLVVYPYHYEDWDKYMYFQLEERGNTSVGANGSIVIVTDESKDTLYVDKTAIHVAGDKYYVYQVNDEGIRYIQYVEIGLEGDDYTEISSGLSEGDNVVI